MLTKDTLKSAGAKSAQTFISIASIKEALLVAEDDFVTQYRALLAASIQRDALRKLLAENPDKGEFTSTDIADVANTLKDPHLSFVQLLGSVVSLGVGGPVAVGLQGDGHGGQLAFRFGNFIPAVAEAASQPPDRECACGDCCHCEAAEETITQPELPLAEVSADSGH